MVVCHGCSEWSYGMRRSRLRTSCDVIYFLFVDVYTYRARPASTRQRRTLQPSNSPTIELSTVELSNSHSVRQTASSRSIEGTRSSPVLELFYHSNSSRYLHFRSNLRADSTAFASSTLTMSSATAEPLARFLPPHIRCKELCECVCEGEGERERVCECVCNACVYVMCVRVCLHRRVRAN